MRMNKRREEKEIKKEKGSEVTLRAVMGAEKNCSKNIDL